MHVLYCQESICVQCTVVYSSFSIGVHRPWKNPTGVKKEKLRANTIKCEGATHMCTMHKCVNGAPTLASLGHAAVLFPPVGLLHGGCTPLNNDPPQQTQVPPQHLRRKVNHTQPHPELLSLLCNSSTTAANADYFRMHFSVFVVALAMIM
jgi:hypothetical protein